MTKDKETYLVALTRTVDAMLTKAKAGEAGYVTDPSAEEIATEHFKGFAISGAIIEDVRKQLPKIRIMLERDFNRRVYLLSRNYYRYFRTSSEKLDEKNAKRCVPGMGHGVDAYGIRLHTDENDPIFKESMRQNTKSASAKGKTTIERLLDACKEKRMDQNAMGELMQDIRREMEPSDPKLVEKAIKGYAELEAAKKGKKARA